MKVNLGLLHPTVFVFLFPSIGLFLNVEMVPDIGTILCLDLGFLCLFLGFLLDLKLIQIQVL